MRKSGISFSCNGTKWQWTKINTSIKITSISFAILFLSSVLVPIGVVLAVTTFVDSFDVSGEETEPRAIAFNTDGTKMFVIGYDSDRVHEYSCTTGFDVSTCADANSPSIDISALETTPDGLAFNTDGTKMFVVGGTNDLVHEFGCTTGFDVSTCTDSSSPSPNISDTDLTSTGLAFNSDGTKMYIVGVNERVGEYDCTTGFDVSTCSADFDRSLNIDAQDPNPHDIEFNTDGTKMFIVGENADNIEVYGCTTGFDVSTCTYSGDGQRFSVTNEDTSPSGLAFSSNGLKMFVLGLTGNDVNEYTLEVAFDFISSAPASTSSTSTTQGNSKGCRSDCSPPTLGVSQDFKRMVDYGFSYNGNPVQVQRYHTDYPLITVQVGKQNVAELIIYENRGERKLTHVGLAFGLDSNQHFADSPAIIEWDRKLTGEETITQIDPNNVIDDGTLRIESSKVKCTEDGKEDRCTLLKIFHKFRDKLEFNIVKTNIWDSLRNGWQNTFNHGIHIDGKSMNPPVQHTVLDKRDRILITEIAKDTAIDVRGNIWTFDKSWKKEYIRYEVIYDGVTMHLYPRDHSQFDIYKKGQELYANKILDKICPRCSDEPFDKIDNTFAYDLPKEFVDRSANQILQSDIAKEIVKAEQKYHYLYDKLDRHMGK